MAEMENEEIEDAPGEVTVAMVALWVGLVVCGLLLFVGGGWSCLRVLSRRKQIGQSENKKSTMPTMPLGWEAHYDECAKKAYYFHVPTQLTTWDKPTARHHRSVSNTLSLLQYNVLPTYVWCPLLKSTDNILCSQMIKNK